MKYYTLDDIMELKPCYNRKELETYMEGRKRISLSGVLNSKASDDDKVWLVLRLLPIDKATKFARWCADSVSHLSNECAREAYTRAYDPDVYSAYWTAYAAADAAHAVHAAAYNEARQQQVTQLKLIVKEHKL